MSSETLAHTVVERCDILARFSEEEQWLTRRFATTPMKQVNQIVAEWMRAANMRVEQDALGNVIGRYEAETPSAKTLLLGSHLDTVRNAGKYDGPLGVLTALACIERLHEQHKHLPFALEVLAFADEEGLRYHSSYLGSKAMTGAFEQSLLQQTDAEDISMAEAIRAFGGNPAAITSSRWRREEVLGYCEVHIEQGPVLELLNLPVGVVSSIAGQERSILTFTGEAGHAGTVPMALRHDALCAAAEFVQAVETLGREMNGLVATIGQLTVLPGASNVIPGAVTLSLDIRHQENATREQARHLLRQQAQEICQRRQITLNWQFVQAEPTIFCSPRLVQLVAQSIEQLNYPLHMLPSGAGHDGVMLSKLTDIAMLFVRCKGGISHNPAESVRVEDVAVALTVMERFLTLLSQKEASL